MFDLNDAATREALFMTEAEIIADQEPWDLKTAIYYAELSEEYRPIREEWNVPAAQVPDPYPWLKIDPFTQHPDGTPMTPEEIEQTEKEYTDGVLEMFAEEDRMHPGRYTEPTVEELADQLEAAYFRQTVTDLENLYNA